MDEKGWWLWCVDFRWLPRFLRVLGQRLVFGSVVLWLLRLPTATMSPCDVAALVRELTANAALPSP